MKLQRLMDEQLVLAALLDQPRANGWELAGIAPRLFAAKTHREIATALCEVRDSGETVSATSVFRALKGKGQTEAAGMVRPLVRAIGTSVGLTEAVSRLTYQAAQRDRR